MPTTDQEIRQRAEARAQIRITKRRELLIHLVVYLVALPFIWAFFAFLAWANSDPNVLIAAVIATLGWGFAVAAHAGVVFVESRDWDAARDREIAREVARELMIREANADTFEKPKRDRLVRLSDDGELIASDDDSQRYTQAAKE
ncbi:MAG: 2TM domain-containing protein [Anaerolineae bacterium]|nr:2TM domain-containing protein [Anaerolineae bacterium]